MGCCSDKGRNRRSGSRRCCPSCASCSSPPSASLSSISSRSRRSTPDPTCNPPTTIPDGSGCRLTKPQARHFRAQKSLRAWIPDSSSLSLASSLASSSFSPVSRRNSCRSVDETCGHIGRCRRPQSRRAPAKSPSDRGNVTSDDGAAEEEDGDNGAAAPVPLLLLLLVRVEEAHRRHRNPTTECAPERS